MKETFLIRMQKSALWPAVLSGLVAPGLGQISNREFGKGFLLLGAFLGSFVWFSVVITEMLTSILPGAPEQWSQNQAALREAIVALVNQKASMFLTFQVLMLLVWGFSVVDAYISAKKRLQAPPPDEAAGPDL